MGVHATPTTDSRTTAVRAFSSHFDLLRPNSDTHCQLTIGMPGLHNALNAAGAAALCVELDIPEEAIRPGPC